MAGVRVPAECEGKLRELVREFLVENATINLSAHRTEERCWTGNVLDSLALLEVIPLLPMTPPQLKILDVGTGGGFPLLPLAVCLKGAAFTGIDATAKKVAAVRRIAEVSGLRNVELIVGRAEALGQDAALRKRFDVVTARAVAGTSALLELCAPFARPGGKIVLWKSLRADMEIRDSLEAQEKLGCHLAARHEYDLPGSWGRRLLLIFEKE